MRTLLAALLVPLLGCPTPVEAPDWCEGGTRYDYDPQHGGDVESLPDDFWTLPADTATGLTIHLETDETPGVDAYGGAGGDFLSVFDHLSELDGWGLTAGVVIRFVGRLDPASLTSESAVFVVLPDGAAPFVIAADVQLTDYDMTAILRPRTPLPEATTVAAVVFGGARGDDGQCVAPSRQLKELLSPASELEAGVPADVRSPDYLAAVEALGLGPEQVAAMVTFTTQSATGLSFAVAADIASREAPEPTAPFACAYNDVYDWTECDGHLPVLDYRGPDRVIATDSDGSPIGAYEVPVMVWLPGDGTGGPFPTVMYGHGLAHDRTQGTKVSRRLTASDGVAVIAIDSVEHGDHPSRTDVAIDFLGQMTFFGIGFSPPSVDARLIRDNWRQSTFDKLQVLQTIQAGFDVDGDGVVDLDSDRLVYYGLSLGAIMGAELLALTDAFDGAVLNVPGGRTTGIIRDSDLFSPLIDVMSPEGTSEGDVQRYFPLLQALVDPGDAMVWAPLASDVPLLVQSAHLDTTMPNSTSDPLVRSFGLLGVGREVWPIPDTTFVPGPVEGRGFQQFDEITDVDHLEAASHDNLMTSDEAWGAARTFLLELLDGGPGTVTDPYSD